MNTQDQIREMLDRVNSQSDLVIEKRQVNPHFQGDWGWGDRQQQMDTLLHLQDAVRGEIDVTVEWDESAGVGRLTYDAGCGCCGEECGYEFRVKRAGKMNWNLCQV